jgi:hypothetical protein
MKYVWTPPRDVVNEANVTGFMESRGFKTYADLVRRSTEDIKWFWGNLPEWLELEWFKEPREVYDSSKASSGPVVR